jgi:hypothetical protein
MSGIRVAPASRSQSIRVATAVRLLPKAAYYCSEGWAVSDGFRHDDACDCDVLVVEGGLIVADIAPRGAANR